MLVGCRRDMLFVNSCSCMVNVSECRGLNPFAGCHIGLPLGQVSLKWFHERWGTPQPAPQASSYPPHRPLLPPGFVSFVLSLKKGMYLYQFSQFAWTHTIVLVVIVPSSFLVANLFEGIIWWMLPSALVIANDICAYLAGGCSCS